jgi:hypothetical protein
MSGDRYRAFSPGHTDDFETTGAISIKHLRYRNFSSRVEDSQQKDGAGDQSTLVEPGRLNTAAARILLGVSIGGRK